MSTFHAILVGIFCLCILLFDDAVNEDPVWWELNPGSRFTSPPTKGGLGWTWGGQLNPLRLFCFAGEILHWWKLTLPSQQATSYLVRQTRWAALVKVTPSSKYSNPRSAPVTRLSSSTLCFPDLLLIFYYWKAIGDKFFVIHHVAALYAYYYVLVSALLSNSRTCRQDGKETTKSEQLRPPTLWRSILAATTSTHIQIKTCRASKVRVLGEYALECREGKCSTIREK